MARAGVARPRADRHPPRLLRRARRAGRAGTASARGGASARRRRRRARPSRAGRPAGRGTSGTPGRRRVLRRLGDRPRRSRPPSRCPTRAPSGSRWTPLRKLSSPTQPSNIAMTAAPFWYVMPSKAFSMSSFAAIGWRMRRAVTSESWSIAREREPTRAATRPAPFGLPAVDDLRRHPRRERLVEPDVVPPGHRHEVAEPLVRGLVGADARVRAAGSGSSRRQASRGGALEAYVTRPGFSIAPNPTVCGITRWSSFSYGYGMSKYVSSSVEDRPRRLHGPARLGGAPFRDDDADRRLVAARRCPRPRRRTGRRRARRDSSAAASSARRRTSSSRRPRPSRTTTGVFETAIAPLRDVERELPRDVLNDGLVEARERAPRVDRLELAEDVPVVSLLLPEEALGVLEVDAAPSRRALTSSRPGERFL